MSETIDYVIRAAGDDDFARACRLYDALDRAHEEARPDRFFAPEGPRRPQQEFEAVIARPDAAIFVAEAGGELIGLAQCEVRDVARRRDAYERRFVYIENLVVAPSHRGRGVGRALLEHVHAWARERGIAHVELYVWEFNGEARALYERVGYRTAGRTMEYKLPDG